MMLSSKLFAGVVASIGLVIVASGIEAYWDKFQAQRWPGVNGVILSSSVCSWHSGKGSTAYMPRIAYAYAIGTEVHKSDAVRFGPAVVNRTEAEEAVQRFSRGTKAIVYVDPGDHRRAVLDRDHVTGAVKWEIGCGLGLLVAGAVLLIALRK
jgi:hypothetical protein